MNKANVETMSAAGWNLKGIKTWRSHDGGGFQVNLCKDKKKVAEFTDSGHGGGVYPTQVFDKELLEQFQAEVKALPQWFCYDKMIDMSEDIVITDMLNDIEEKKQIAKLTKNHVCRDLGNGKIEKFKINATWTRAKLTAYIKETHGEDAIILGGE